MHGEEGAEGLVPHVCDALFHMSAVRPNTLFTVRLSFMEIYLKKCFDLLDDNASKGVRNLTGGDRSGRQLELTGSTEEGFKVEGLTERAVSSSREVGESNNERTNE